MTQPKKRKPPPARDGSANNLNRVTAFDTASCSTTRAKEKALTGVRAKLTVARFKRGAAVRAGSLAAAADTTTRNAWLAGQIYRVHANLVVELVP